MTALRELMIFAGLVVFLAVAGIAGVIRSRIERHGILVLAWRWLTGHPHHGKALTDAGWLRPGSKALTRTGHASRFHHRPRLHRTAMRTGPALATLAAAWGLLRYRHTAIGVLATLGALGVATGAVLAVRRLLARRHRRAWVEPLHATVAPLAGVPVANAPGSWLHVERDRSQATLTLPEGWHGTAHERGQIATAVTTKLGLAEPDIRWQLAGPARKLVVTAVRPPPRRVTLDDILPAIEDARPGVLVLGTGRREETVTVSLRGDSPHIGLSMGTGAGKSTLARLILAQHLHHGGIGLVLDAKRISHSWTWGLPNCGYADEPEDIHDALIWLDRELDRRTQVAKRSTDVEGVVHANVGPPLMVVAEELNLAVPQLRALWAGIRHRDDVAKSPAIQSMENVAFAGRAVRVHLLMIGQMLSARTTGSGEARENLGVRILARYSQRAWQMMAPELPAPPVPSVLGRVQVVASGKVRETQVAVSTGAQARQLATNGVLTPLPAGMPGATAAPSYTPAGQIASGAEVTLSEACKAGVLSMSLSAARTARHRDPAFPGPSGMRGPAHVYDAKALAAYERTRS